MKYPFSKEEFLNVQDKLYDAIEDIMEKDIIANVGYKLYEQEFNYVPDKDIVNNRKYTANVYEWLREIKFLKGKIFEELLLCLAYNEIYGKFDSPLKGTLKFVNQERYLKLAVYDLFTFRENIAFLIYELFNRQLKNSISKDFRKNDISFDKINNALTMINIYEQNINWINSEEFKVIKYVMNEFSTNENVKIFKEIRHPFTHRSNPGIGCVPLRSFEYEQADEDVQKAILKMDRGLIEGSIENRKYIVVSSKPVEKTVPFEEVIDKSLKVWALFAKGLERLLKDVEILNKHIIEFY